MENKSLPKILIVSRGVWDDSKGTSSTLTNVFGTYDPQKLGHVYIETIKPNTVHCNSFFQISEFSLVRKLYHWRMSTGLRIENSISQTGTGLVDEVSARREARTMKYVRGHRSILFSFAREILWMFNGWKSKELRNYIKDFNPDIVWMDGSPLILMNRLGMYILRKSQKPFILFLQDDAYTYKSCPENILHRGYRFLIRKHIRNLVKMANMVFVASPKMKEEYDKIFGIKSLFLTKGIDFSKISYKDPEIHVPIRFVYLGQVIYGRIYSLIALAKAMAEINKDGVKMTLSVYTNNEIPSDLKNEFLIDGTSEIRAPVPYDQVSNVIAENDVVVFVESFEKKYKNIARLSFSTKITDYLSSGKCILAIGPSDIAPIEYLKKENAALVVSASDDIHRCLKTLTTSQEIKTYAHKAYMCGLRNHNMAELNQMKLTLIKSLVAKKS